jgi:hypothetical protein
MQVVEKHLEALAVLAAMVAVVIDKLTVQAELVAAAVVEKHLAALA